jgi:translocation and assembly module TamA
MKVVPKRQRARWLAATIVLGACAAVPPVPDAVNAREVDAIDIEGAIAISEHDILEKIVTSESSWVPHWVPFLGKAAWFDEGSWQADLRRIRRFYEASGYYQARVLDDHATEVRPGHVRLLVKVREGLPARLTSLTIEGVDGVAPELRAGMLERLPLRTQDIFVEGKWSALKFELLNRVRERGYAEALLAAEALVDTEAPSVAAALKITPGLRYRFGDVFVPSNPGSRVPRKFVVENSGLHPGDWYSETALSDARERLLRMGVFSGVKVTRGATEPSTQTVSVNIDTQEAPMRNLRASLGVGGDLVRQEARLIGEFIHHDVGLARLVNDNARLDRLTIKGKVGWAFMPTVLAVYRNDPTSQTGPVFRALTDYEVPRFFGIPTLSFQTSLNLSRALDVSYNYVGGELRTGVAWRPRLDFTLSPSINYNLYSLNTPVRLAAASPTAAIGCPVAPKTCMVAFLELAAEWDRREHKLEPREGFYVGLNTKGGLSETTALRPYFQISPEARGYVSFGPTRVLTLAGKVRAGTLLAPNNETPIIARFFSGGNSMRGFNQRRLSPLIVAESLRGESTSSEIADTLAIGGSGLFEASLEVRWNFSETFVFALFTDWGLVTVEPLGRQTDFTRHLYAAVGFGARYRTPLGPVRLDLGFRLPFLGGPLQVENGPGSQFRSTPSCFEAFGVGRVAPSDGPLDYAGAPENPCSINLSIGEAF